MRANMIRAMVATVAIVGLAAPVALAGGLPKVPDSVGHLGGSQFQVKPSSIIVSGDGSFYFDGAKKSHNHAAPLKWSSWTMSGGDGSGFNWVNNCKPNCASGTFHLYPVKLHVSNAKHVGGHFIFTRMTVTYTGKWPAHFHKTGVYKVTHKHGNFFWSFPSGQ